MKRILFQGDSITDCSRNREDFYSTGGGYPKLVKAVLGFEHLGEYEFINRGILGNRITDLYARRQEDLMDLAPDYLSLYIGVNDVWQQIDYQSGVENAEFEELYQKLLTQLWEMHPQTKVLLIAPFVLRGPATENREDQPHRWERFSQGVAEKAAITKKIARQYGLPVIDLQAAFDEACQRAPASYWTWDGVHPSAYGHELIKRLWLAAFEQMK